MRRLLEPTSSFQTKHHIIRGFRESQEGARAQRDSRTAGSGSSNNMMFGAVGIISAFTASTLASTLGLRFASFRRRFLRRREPTAQVLHRSYLNQHLIPLKLS